MIQEGNMKGDILSFLKKNNTDCAVEDPDGKPQRANLVKQIGAQDVALQDQHTRLIDTKINRVLDDTITLSAIPTVNIYDLTLTTGHGVIIGDFLAFLEQNGYPQIYFGKVLNVVVDVITMDTRVPFPYTPASTIVLKYDTILNVNGSITAVIPYLINAFTDSIDITELVFMITDNVVMDSAKFGGISALTRGIALRKKLIDGTYINYWNVKTNANFAELGTVTYDPKAPAGVYGLKAEIDLAGQENHGVTIRLAPGESIELLIQDNLTDLTSFEMMVHGHIVED